MEKVIFLYQLGKDRTGENNIKNGPKIDSIFHLWMKK